MPTVDVRRATGERAGSVTLDPALFEVTPNVAVMHQVVTAQLAAARAGGQHTLTRAEVRGGGRKPWRQKGSGRARQGSSRSPHWRGGGVAMGPKPRSYSQRTPKKMIQLALRSALSDRAGENRVAVVDSWPFEAPRTKDAKALLDALGLEGNVLVVVSARDHMAERSFRNLPDVALVLDSELNAYDVLCNDWVLFTRATLPGAHPDDAATEQAPEPAARAPEPEAAEQAPEPAAHAAPEPEAVEAAPEPEPPAEASPEPPLGSATSEPDEAAASASDDDATTPTEPDWDKPLRKGDS